MADVIRKVRNKIDPYVKADVLAEHGDRVWVLKEGYNIAYTSDAESWEDIPAAPVPKVGEWWGYGAENHGLKWLVVNVNEVMGHWSMVETNNHGFTKPEAFNDPGRTEKYRSDINGYTRRLPEESMVRKNDQSSNYDPFAD